MWEAFGIGLGVHPDESVPVIHSGFHLIEQRVAEIRGHAGKDHPGDTSLAQLQREIVRLRPEDF